MASTTSFTVKLVGGAYWELPFRYTGEVRGILCFNCNGGLGQFGDDVINHKENLSARLRCLVQLARQLVDGLALPGQVIGARRERLGDIDDGHRRFLGGVLKLLGDLGLGLGVVDQRRHLVGVDQVEHGGQVGGRRVAVLFDRFGEAFWRLVGNSGVDE